MYRVCADQVFGARLVWGLSLTAYSVQMPKLGCGGAQEQGRIGRIEYGRL